MATWRPENSMLTQRGVEILNKLKAGVGSITVTRIVAGSGRVAESFLFQQTSISGVQKPMTISAKNTTDVGSEIAFYIENKDFTEPYELHQIGIYVTHPDYVGEQLYHISQCDANDYDTIPAISYTPVTQGYSVFMEHGNSSSVNITVDPSGMVNTVQFNEFKESTADTIHRIETDVENRYTKTETDTLLKNKADSKDLQSHATSKSNPHGVTAAQTGAYSKKESDTLLANKVGVKRVENIDLDTLMDAGIYILKGDNCTNTPLNPSFVAHSTMFVANGPDGIPVQVLTTTNKVAYSAYANRRFFRSNFDGWSEWRELATTDKALMKNSGYIGPLTDYSVLNNYKESGIWCFVTHNQDNPFGNAIDGALFDLFVIESKYAGVNTSVVQYAICSYPTGSDIKGSVWVRAYYYAGEWSDWRRLAYSDEVVSKTGNSIVRGILGVKQNGTTMCQLLQWDTTSRIRNVANDGSWYSDLIVEKDYLLFEKVVNGVLSESHVVLHTGNVTAGTTDLTAGSSSLANGCIYQVYE